MPFEEYESLDLGSLSSHDCMLESLDLGSLSSHDCLLESLDFGGLSSHDCLLDLQAAGALWSLCVDNDGNKQRVADVGAIPHLIGLLHASDTFAQSQVCSAITMRSNF